MIARGRSLAVKTRGEGAGLFPAPPSYRSSCTETMPEPNLLVISASAFIAVIVLLSLLAGIIRLLTILFPAHEDSDATLVAAITAAAARAYPGTRISKIEETR